MKKINSPDVKGVAEYKDCPIPDRDNDGIADNEDKCPAGSSINGGCVEIKKELIARVNMVARQIFFNTGSYQILQKSFPSLNDIVQALKENPALNLMIEGHTDTREHLLLPANYSAKIGQTPLNDICNRKILMPAVCNLLAMVRVNLMPLMNRKRDVQ
jgi:hypothetical protein